MKYPREELIKRLRYRSWHRGCKETDIILGPFADKYLESFTNEELYLFEELLEQDDWDIWAWIIGKKPLPDALDNSVTQRLLKFKTHEALS